MGSASATFGNQFFYLIPNTASGKMFHYVSPNQFSDYLVTVVVVELFIYDLWFKLRILAEK